LELGIYLEFGAWDLEFYFLIRKINVFNNIKLFAFNAERTSFINNNQRSKIHDEEEKTVKSNFET